MHPATPGPPAVCAPWAPSVQQCIYASLVVFPNVLTHTGKINGFSLSPFCFDPGIIILAAVATFELKQNMLNGPLQKVMLSESLNRFV